MSFHCMENSGLNTSDPALNVPEQVCWDAVEAVRQERSRISREEHSSGSEEVLSGQGKEKSGDEENLLYSLWCELHHGSEKETNFSTDLSSFSLSEAKFDKQPDERQWEDKVHVAPRHVEARKVRIEERSRIQPVSSKQELGVEEAKWRDTAAVAPQKGGTRRLRIRAIKALEPIGLPGEFDHEED